MSQNAHRKRNNDILLQGTSVFGLGRLNHVAIACPNMEKAAAFYRDTLGAKVSEKVVSF